jgi:hypothetical protein
MSRITSEYPERVYASSVPEKKHRLIEQMRSTGKDRLWLIGGLAAIGLGIWAAYKFGPDLARYIKMERM